jgi:hypothetical protein
MIFDGRNYGVCPPEAGFRMTPKQQATTTSKGGVFADLAAGRRRAFA